MAIAAFLVTLVTAAARDYCANLDRALEVLQIQVGSADASPEVTSTYEFAMDTSRNDEAMMDFVECWKLGGVRDADVERAIDGLIVQLRGKFTVGRAAGALSYLGRPALRALPALEAALDREKTNGHSQSFNGPRVERSLIYAVSRLKALNLPSE